MTGREDLLEDEVTALKEQLSGCEVERDVAVRAFQDTNTELLFWKAAAERALRLWDKVQDDLDKRDDVIQRWFHWSHAMITKLANSDAVSRFTERRLIDFVDKLLADSGFNIEDHT